MKNIPKSFYLFGSKVDVVFDEQRMNDKKLYGESDYSRLTLTLCKTDKTEPLSEDLILDTFYHEKVHMILDSMKENDLSSNEKFVDTFAKLLRQSDITATF